MDQQQTALVAQLQTPSSVSKKYRMVMLGVICIMIIFFISVGAMMFKVEIAGSIASLSQIIVTAIGGMVALYAGAQAWSESSTATALGKTSG